MKTKMRSLVKARPEKGLSMQEVPVPRPGPTDVLVKIHFTSICGTDLHIYNWDAWSQKHVLPPMVIGHEFAGTIEETGSSVRGLKVGDIVTGEGHIVCGECRNCLAGRRHMCPHTKGVGVDREGCFAEYLCIPASNVWKADPSIPMEVLSYFDPLGNATHTALSFDLIGEDVLITGAGPTGLMATAISKHVGARYVVVTDLNPYRLTLARKLGATVAFDPREKKLEEVQRELGMKEGFDVGMEMSGSPEALRSMLANMRHGGGIALLGILPQNTAIDWDKVIFSSLFIKGIYGREMFETWYKMTSMLLSGLDVMPLLTHRFPAAEFEKGFAAMQTGNCGKVVLEWL